MAWLHVPGLGSAPELADSSLASDLSWTDIGLWATSSGRALLRRYSWSGWKRRPWSARLFGTISRPSMAERGVAEWISSLPVSRVSRSRSRVNSGGSRTSDGCGRMWSESLGRFGPDGLFSRTCLDLFDTGSDMSSVDWPDSGTMRNGVCSVQVRLELRTSAQGSSSLHGSTWDRGEYPTPSATPYGTSQNEGEVEHRRPTAGTPSLETWARLWQTPATPNGGRGVPLDAEMDGQTLRRADGQKVQIMLENQARGWATPAARDGKDTGTLAPRTDGVGAFAERKDQLGRQVAGWPTPLPPVAWPTPSTEQRHDYQNDHGDPTKPYPTLQGAAKSWPTARAEDGESSGRRHSRDTEDTLTATSRSFPPDLTTSSCGEGCSPSHRRLNPRFVEWLMGWPVGWTDVRIGCGPSATELSRWRSRMRSALLQLVAAGWRS